jgi:hypothetical protein
MVALSVSADYTGNAQLKSEILTNKSVIDLHKAGLDDDLIVSKIQSSECKFDVTANGMIDLKNKGVPQPLIKIMMNKMDGKPLNFQSEQGSSVAPGGGSAKSNKKVSGTGRSEPSNLDLLNYVYCVGTSDQSAKPLEKSIAKLRHKTNLIVAEYWWELDGVKSAIRISAAEASKFWINTGGSNAPDYVLFKADAKKNVRKAQHLKGGTFGTNGSKDLIMVNITKIAEGSYQLSPGVSLAKGEYFFMPKPSAGVDQLTANVYAFGID